MGQARVQINQRLTAPPPASSSQRLRLTSEAEKQRLRLTSEPVTHTTTHPGAPPDYQYSESMHQTISELINKSLVFFRGTLIKTLNKLC